MRLGNRSDGPALVPVRFQELCVVNTVISNTKSLPTAIIELIATQPHTDEAQLTPPTVPHPLSTLVYSQNTISTITCAAAPTHRPLESPGSSPCPTSQAVPKPTRKDSK